jgi:enoyl-CoA hydratase/carnithine racemase
VTTELVHRVRRGPVCSLTLDSPHNRNALSSQLLDELADGLAEAAADPAVRVVVLTATGKAFCSGADLSAPPTTVTSRMPEVLEAIRSAPVPVIARVGGHARAGGLGLIATADLAVATAASTFAFSEVRVGVAPAMILVPALRVADRRFLSRAALTGEPFGTADAAAAGLLTGVVDDERALDAWVDEAVAAILKCAPGAVSATKALLAALSEAPWSEGLSMARARSAELFAGAEAAEGMDAFLNKRTPSWEVAAP